MYDKAAQFRPPISGYRQGIVRVQVHLSLNLAISGPLPYHLLRILWTLLRIGWFGNHEADEGDKVFRLGPWDTHHTLLPYAIIKHSAILLIHPNLTIITRRLHPAIASSVLRVQLGCAQYERDA